MSALTQIMSQLQDNPAYLSNQELEELILWSTACLTAKNNATHLRKRPKFLNVSDAVVINSLGFSHRGAFMSFLWSLAL